MEEKKDLLEKWLEFREEELETGLSKEDKKHMYDFEKCTDMVLNCIDGDMYNFAKKELDKLEENILDSMGHFLISLLKTLSHFFHIYAIYKNYSINNMWEK